MSFLLSKEDRKKIIDALNSDLSGEIGAIIQYLHHHYLAEGLESPAITRKTASKIIRHT